MGELCRDPQVTEARQQYRQYGQGQYRALELHQENAACCKPI